MTLARKAIENIVGKGENAVNQHFSFSNNGFLTYLRNLYFSNICLSSENAFSLDKSYILLLSKELNIVQLFATID